MIHYDVIKRKRFLHLGTDEKFLNSANQIYEDTFPGENYFLIVVEDVRKPLKYVNVISNVAVIPNDLPSKKLVERLCQDVPHIVLHGLDEFKCRAFLNSNSREKFIWTIWGGEIYNNPHVLGLKLYGKRTQKKFINPISFTLKKWLRPWYYRVRYSRKDLYSLQLDVIKNVTHIAGQPPEDFYFLRDRGLIKDDTKHTYFSYYPHERIFNSGPPPIVDDENILIGNSASATNNHLEIFEKISSFDLRNRKVVVPLSYGSPSYADIIAERGKSLFKDQLQVLRQFMPMDEYNLILRSCGIVIMNHHRQQAVGNIVATVYMGAKLYLNEQNTVYKYLQRIGCHVFSINKDLVVTNSTALVPLLPEQIEQNRKVIKREISMKTISDELKAGFPIS